MAYLFQGNTQDAAIQVGHINFGLRQRVRQLDAHVLNEVISVSLELGVWNLPHNENQILQIRFPWNHGLLDQPWRPMQPSLQH